jgi:nucleoid-associated protein YgaU
MLADKYRSLMDLANQLRLSNLNTAENGGKLEIKGTAPYQMEKDLFWDKVKSFPGWEQEVAADIRVEKTDIYGEYKVQAGDSLSKIAKKFLGDANKYPQIAAANKDTIKDPNKINIGQVIKLPNK